MNNIVKQAIRSTEAWPLNPNSILIAGPSSGKTWLQSKYPQILDSDDVWNKWGFFKDWHEMPNSREIPLAWIMRFITNSRNHIWLTNIWGKEYLDILMGSSRKGVIMVYRDNPVLIRDTMHARSGFTPELKARYSLTRIKGWVKAWDKYAHTVSSQVIVLKDDQYLADVVVPVRNPSHPDSFTHWKVKGNGEGKERNS